MQTQKNKDGGTQQETVFDDSIANNNDFLYNSVAQVMTILVIQEAIQLREPFNACDSHRHASIQRCLWQSPAFLPHPEKGASALQPQFGGWSEEGVIRFNELCSIVVEDRSSRNAMDAEEEVMLSLRRQKYGEEAVNGVGNTNEQQSIAGSERSLERNIERVNAFIELW